MDGETARSASTRMHDIGELFERGRTELSVLACRKKSRSRSPWEDKSPPGQAARLVGSSNPDESQSRHSSRDPASQSDRPMEKRTRSEPLLREAGEIADDRHQRRHRNEERSHRCCALSVSSQEQMETANAERTANNVPAAGDDRRTKEGTVGLPPAPRRPDSSPSRGDRRGPSSREGRRTPVKGDRESQQKPVTPPRLTAIPAEIGKRLWRLRNESRNAKQLWQLRYETLMRKAG